MTPEEVAAVEGSLVAVRFLGCAPRVAPALRDVLRRVERALLDEHAATAPGVPFELWHGVHSVGGYRKAAAYHGKGLAIDVDYTLNPYVATRTDGTLGGEAAGAHLGVRRAAVEACDRACGGPGKAALHARRKGESTAQVFDRFEAVSAAVRAYFAPYFGSVARTIRRRPVPRFALAPLDAFAPLAPELLPGVKLSDVPLQVLRDYEGFRIPTVVGAPSTSPAETRNPVRGLMNLRRPVVIALCDVGGLRWGMSDFGKGSSGDGMHFDTARRIHA